MKKILLSALYLVMAAGAMLFVQSCTKEKNNSHVFYATIQQYKRDSKAHIETTNHGNRFTCWDINDTVQMQQHIGIIRQVVVDPDATDQYQYYIDFGNAYIGSLNNYTTIEYAAYYPVSIVNVGYVSPSTTTVIETKCTQKYKTTNSGYQKIEAPMVAYLPTDQQEGGGGGPREGQSMRDYDHHMEFKNIAALIEVNVSGSCIVTRIEVENTGKGESTVTFDGQAVSAMSGRPLWGDFRIEWDSEHQAIMREMPFWNSNTDPALKYVTKEITLECEEHGDYGGVEVNGSHPFYIWVPPVEYDSLHVTVYAKHQEAGVLVERCTTLISTKNSHFAANTVYPLSVTYSDAWTKLSRAHDLGPYTIYTYEEVENEQTVTKRKQVEFAFSNLHNDGRTTFADGDAFFEPPYQYDYVGYHDPNNDHDHFAYSRLGDIRSDGSFGTDQGWTLLSYDEWTYLLGPEDMGQPFAHRNDAKRFVNVMVASVPGIILFPDNEYCTLPSFVNSLRGINHIMQNFTGNTISLPNFYALENAGCVFLPCVYYSEQQATSGIKDEGYYWTRTTTEEGPKKIVIDPGTRISLDDDNDASGAMVRLVRDYVAATSSKK